MRRYRSRFLLAAVVGVSVGCQRSATIAECSSVAISAVGPDSLCGLGCRLVAIDTIVREVRILQLGNPAAGPIAAVLRASDLLSLGSLGRSAHLGRVAVTPPAADTLVIGLQLLRADSLPADVLVFGVSVVPPLGYLTTYAVRLSVNRARCVLENRFLFAQT